MCNMCVNRPGTERIIILHGVAALLQLQQSTQNDCSMQFSDDGPTLRPTSRHRRSQWTLFCLCESSFYKAGIFAGGQNVRSLEAVLLHGLHM